MNKLLTETLQQHRSQFGALLPKQLQQAKIFVFDLSTENSPFRAIVEDVNALIACTEKLMQQHQALIGIGRYGEQRFLYDSHSQFKQMTAESRCVHLGLDITVPPNTPLTAPLDSIVHSFKNNSARGDYGPTIILEHKINDITFFTLYGHLSAHSLNDLSVGKKILKGELFATVGHAQENGGWPPHVHMQIVDSMDNYQGDFPGVASIKEKDAWLARCPDPNLILNLNF